MSRGPLSGTAHWLLILCSVPLVRAGLRFPSHEQTMVRAVVPDLYDEAVGWL